MFARAFAVKPFIAALCWLILSVLAPARDTIHSRHSSGPEPTWCTSLGDYLARAHPLEWPH